MDNTQQEQGMPSGTPTHESMQPTPSGKKPVGPIIGIIIIVIVLVLGAFYFWGRELAQAPTDEMTEELENTSDSDELGAIEGDLNATELDELDGELDSLDSELDTL